MGLREFECSPLNRAAHEALGSFLHRDEHALGFQSLAEVADLATGKVDLVSSAVLLDGNGDRFLLFSAHSAFHKSGAGQPLAKPTGPSERMNGFSLAEGFPFYKGYLSSVRYSSSRLSQSPSTPTRSSSPGPSGSSSATSSGSSG